MSPETPVHVQGHLIYAVEPERVFAGELGQQREPEKGQAHLPAVGVSGELEIEPSGRCYIIRYVRFVGHKDGGALFGEPLEHPFRAAYALQGAIHAAEVQRRPVPVQGSDLVAQLGHAAGGEATPDHLGVRLVVVVSEDGEGSVGGQRRLSGATRAGTYHILERNRE